MRALWISGVLLVTFGWLGEGLAEDAIGTRPLLTVAPTDLQSILPPDCRILIDPHSIEQFLEELDRSPPNWSLVYGDGHHDPNLDERLFMLNRERDAKRIGNPVLTQLITFVWFGELSRYDTEADGFRVSLGPKLTPTQWGLVRFKYDDVQGELVAKASATLRGTLEQRFARGESVHVTVAMTGRLIPDESVVYDFSHDQEGLGVIMPVVKIGRLDYLLTSK